MYPRGIHVIRAAFGTVLSNIITSKEREHYGQKHKKGITKTAALKLSNSNRKDILASQQLFH